MANILFLSLTHIFALTNPYIAEGKDSLGKKIDCYSLNTHEINLIFIFKAHLFCQCERLTLT